MITRIFGSVWLFILLSFNSVFAIEAPSGLTVDSVSSASATLSWEEVSNAAAYSVYYWENSSDLSGKDLVEKSPYTLVGLQDNTIYYVSVVSNDDSFEESDRSEIVQFTTGDNTATTVSSSSSFALENVEVVSENKLKLEFSADINSSEDSPREFKITNKFDELEQLVVFDSEIDEQDKNVLILTMQESIPTSAQYNVTVVRLNDADGNNIQNGIDGIASFVTPDSYEELTQQSDPIEDEKDTELSSAGPSENQVEVSRSTSGQNLSDDQLATTTETTAQKAEKLPDTGAEHWFLGILALMLWAIVFKFRTSRQ